MREKRYALMVHDLTRSSLFRMKGPGYSYEDVILDLIRNRRNNEDAIVKGLSDVVSKELGKKEGGMQVHAGGMPWHAGGMQVHAIVGVGLFVAFLSILFVVPHLMRKND